MTHLELTPAELEMVKLTRQKEELAAKEAALQAQADLEKKIAAKESEIHKAIANDKAQIAAAKKYFNDFDSNLYSLEIIDKPQTAKVIDYRAEDQPLLWSKDYVQQTAVIKSKDGYTVDVKEQFVSTNWHSKSRGYKMYLRGPGIDYKESEKALGRPSTVISKINNAIEKLENARKREQNKKNALAVTVERLTAEYPDAKITVSYEYDRTYRRGRITLGDKYDMISITLKNGICVHYRVWADGSLSQLSISFPKTNAASNMLLAKLNEINF
jgi:hypothetical protein